MMKRHDFDPVSFVSGVFLTTIGLIFLMPRASRDLIVMITRSSRWIWPVLLVTIGVAVLLSAAARMGRREVEEDGEAVD